MPRRSYDQIVDAVTIDVASSGNGKSSFVIQALPFNFEPPHTCSNVLQISRVAQAVAVTEDYIGCTGSFREVVLWRTDDQVIDPVAVNIAGTRHRSASEVEVVGPANLEPATSHSEVGELN